jgi:hypothetical protein
VLGSTFISEADWTRLAKITAAEDLAPLVYLKLDTITALDFEAIATKGAVQWAEADPIHYVPTSGLAISKISSVGIAYVLQQAPELEDAMQEDLRKLSAFVRSNGDLDIYEVAYSSEAAISVSPVTEMILAAEVCAECSMPIEPGQGVLLSKTETVAPTFHRAIHVVLCPTCATQHDRTGNWMLWGMAAFAVLFVVFGLASCIFR